MNGASVLVWPSFSVDRLLGLIELHYVPVAPFQLLTYLKGFDLLHFHDDIDLSFPVSAARLRKPKIFSCHSLAATLGFYARNMVARRLFTESADLFHTFSRHGMRGLRELGIPQEKIRLIPHGVDVSRFGHRRKSSAGTVRIAWLGRIDRTKGIIILLKALSHLKTEHDSLELLIGGDPSDDPRYYRELVDYTRAARLPEVKFVGLIDDSPSFLQQADIFASPSLMETFGIVNLEAMASGLPVVASSVGGILDIVVDNQTGFLVHPGNSLELAEKLRLLINDPKLRQRMGCSGRERAEQLFSIDHVFSRVLNMYHELV